MEQLVTKPVHSLVRQSLKAEMYYGVDGSLWSVNADGSGIGWYADKDEPGLFRDASPAWSNANLHEICRQIKARIILAHVRATTTGTVQNTNCHPFKYGQWLFQHNGHVSAYEKISQILHAEIDPDLYQNIKGTTDSETFFYLALTYGLYHDPKAALHKMVEKVLEASQARGTDGHLNLSCALSDGKKLYILRYSVGESTNSQFYSSNPDCFTDFLPGATEIPAGSTLVVSEPLDRLSDKWKEIPENSFVTIEGTDVKIEKFID